MGTVTDGDIRRGILKGYSLENSIYNIINKNFVYVQKETSESDYEYLMKKHDVKQIPLIDKFGKFINLYVANDLRSPKIKENIVTIMAGGKGTRLYPLTKDCPKPMLKIQNKPILEIILEQCIEQSFRKFYISVNYLKDKIVDYFQDGRKWEVEINYLTESVSLGTAGAISILPKNITKPFLLINGDVLTRVDYSKLIQFHKNKKSICTMSVIEHQTEIPYGVVKLENDNVRLFQEKPNVKNFINAGIYVFNPEIFNFIKKDEYVDIPDFFERIMKKNHTISAFPIHEYWLDIGHHVSLNKAIKEWY